MLDTQAIVKAIDDACGAEIAQLVSVLVEGVVSGSADAADKFKAGLRVVIKANQIADQTVTQLSAQELRV
jgi:hypothetical protein